MTFNLIRREDIPDAIQTKIQEDVNALLSNGAQIVKISTPQEADNAYALVKKVKEFATELKSTSKLFIDPIKKQVEEMQEYFAPAFETLSGIEKNIKQVLDNFTAEQKRIAAENKRIADEKARLKREKEEKEAEEKRREAENKNLEAQAALALGKTDEAQNLLSESSTLTAEADAPPPIPVSEPEPEAYKPKGFSTRKSYSAEVEDENALIKWAIESKEWALLSVNTKALNKLASAKGEYFKVPGARLIVKNTQVIR